MRRTIFADFDRHWPGLIVNITNGITPRRWLHQANPGLSALIAEHIGRAWIADLSALRRLAPLAESEAFRASCRGVKRANKERLARIIKTELGLRVDPSSLFDVQIKRIHEYKRQLLNLLHVVTRYNRLREGRGDDLVPRTVIFSGKAAPGYAMAKLIIRLIHAVADVVNHDPAVRDRLAVAFIPDYGVSVAERIIPGCDLSEQISTAGTEASGTGNMKLALNGALTIGTLDGDNAEIKQALDQIGGNYFSVDAPDRFRPIVDALTRNGDPFFVLADYESYAACQQRVDELYRDPDEWTRRAILNIAGMGRFSSDRAVLEYSNSIWTVNPVRH
jgi:starch phosphorylase